MPLLVEHDSPPKAAWLRRPGFLGLFLFLLIIFAWSFVYLGNIGWPGLHWDAAMYGTPVLNVANGKGWIFGGYGLQVTLRDSLAYNMHGFLHVFIYGVVLDSVTWARYIFAQGIVNSLAFALYSVICLCVQAKASRTSLYSVILSIFIGTVAGVICIGLQGRPEQPVPLILVLPLAAILFVSNRLYLAALLGLSLGLLIVCSPLLGLVFAVFALFYLFGTSDSGFRKFWQDACVTIGVSLFVSICLIWIITPFSPLEWFSQVFEAGQQVHNLLLPEKRDYRLGKPIVTPAWDILSVFLIIVSGIWLWRSKKSWTSMLFLTTAIIFFNGKIWSYSYLPFIPLSLVLCLRKSKSTEDSIIPSHRILKTAAFVVSLSYAIILFIYFSVTIVTPRYQLSQAIAQQRFANSKAGQELASGTAAVGFPNISWPSMVVLGDAGPRYVSFSPHRVPRSDPSLQQYERKFGVKVNWFIYPQKVTKTNSVPPASIYLGANRFTLVDNGWVEPTWVDQKLRLIKLPNRNILQLTSRYNFAIYRRSS